MVSCCGLSPWSPAVVSRWGLPLGSPAAPPPTLEDNPPARIDGFRCRAALAWRSMPACARKRTRTTRRCGAPRSTAWAKSSGCWDQVKAVLGPMWLRSVAVVVAAAAAETVAYTTERATLRTTATQRNPTPTPTDNKGGWVGGWVGWWAGGCGEGVGRWWRWWWLCVCGVLNGFKRIFRTHC